MTSVLCPLERAHAHDTVIVRIEDLPRLRTAAKRMKGLKAGSGPTDGLLFHGVNSELCSIVGLAWTYDNQDQNLLEQQDRFKKAYSVFRDTIAGLESVALRTSVELPADYMKSIDDSILLNYAQEHVPHRAIDWRKDELFVRLLTLYSLFTGDAPKATDKGPCERFMVEVIKIFKQFLLSVPDKTSNKYHLVNELLGRIPMTRPFLKDWFKAKRYTIDIQDQVDFHVKGIIAQYDRIIASRPDHGRVIYGEFGG